MNSYVCPGCETRARTAAWLRKHQLRCKAFRAFKSRRTDVGKHTNPKDTVGTTRPPMQLIMLPAWLHMSTALLEGSKYGAWNWTIAGVRASIYVAAACRHLFKWFFGQRCDPKTRVHHLGSVLACVAILLDAEHRGKLVDDRPPSLPRMDDLFDEIEATAKHLTELFAKERAAAKHYTIVDSE